MNEQPDLAGIDDQAIVLANAVEHHLRYSLARRRRQLSPGDVNRALALAVRERVIDAMFATEDRYERQHAKRAYYLSIEFLIGRILENTLVNLGLLETARAVCKRRGFALETVLAAEPDPALGNGGLGRLAACFLDSLATLDMPGYGYGICYEFGLFRQTFLDGYQVEHADRWLDAGVPWLIDRSDEAVLIPVYGRLEHGSARADGDYNPMWVDWQVLAGIPHDLPIVGYGGRTVNRLRLFSARSPEDFDVALFNQGDYVRAVERKIASERITKLLYPEDSVAAGKELRLLQQYFFVACALRDIIANCRKARSDLTTLPEHAAIQLNDTHPALAIAELMRILVDEEHIDWEQAWEITQGCFGYTNHTLLPEALERWPVSLLERVVPRHLQIIHELNRRFLDRVSVRFPAEPQRRERMSLVEHGPDPAVRMAHLAMIGSHSVNGVAAIHTQLIKESFGREFAEMFPDRFNNKTNGVTQRRWVLTSNPLLAEAITQRIGSGWITDLDQFRRLEEFVGDADFVEQLAAIKTANKERLARDMEAVTGTSADPASLFDVHAKRMHEYKRQLLGCLSVIDSYLSIMEDGTVPPVARTAVFAGKAAPGYHMAKLIIRLINGLSERINSDPRASAHLKVVLVPDYRVSVAERLIPAADLSEQVSTAGFEASGTGNMKFAMNGALTIGTLDGANIEICEEVGPENIFIFGLQVDEVRRLSGTGAYRSRDIYDREPRVRRAVDSLRGDMFCPGQPGLFEPIARALLDGNDRYFVLADFIDYARTKERACRDFQRPQEWHRRALLNIARMGRFSSDRTIRQYASEIWEIGSVP